MLNPPTTRFRPFRSRFRSESPPDRRGFVLVAGAALMILVLAFAALTIDVGWMSLTKTQMQSAVDAAALAGAMELDPTEDQAVVAERVRDAAVEMTAMHLAGDQHAFNIDRDRDVKLGRRTWNGTKGEFEYEWGPTAVPYNVVRVYGTREEREEEDAQGEQVVVDNRLPLFFAPVIGHNRANLKVQATASMQPRDIVLVLDYSASMNDDTEYGAIGSLTQADVEAALRQMWVDLGEPTYGNLTHFDPEWLTAPGVPRNNSQKIPHIDVEWTGYEVSITSTHDIEEVWLRYTDGDEQQFNIGYLNTKTRTLEGTGNDSGKKIKTVWVRSWENNNLDTYGYGDGEVFEFGNEDIVKHLGLDEVDYPYSAGDWINFVNYCANSSSSQPNYSRDVYDAGYRRKFGLMSLMSFWNEEYPLHSQSEGLWQASQQPLQSVKDGSYLLLDWLGGSNAQDKIALVSYTDPANNGARLEHELTDDFDAIRTIIEHRQAGHYDYYTNIAAGMQKGRIELVENGRPRTYPMIILMTDGLANRSPTSESAYNACLTEADLAAENSIPIMTISVGSGADSGLMQEIADRTGGTHFNVPGGTSIATMASELQQVFSFIAADRRLKLIESVDD